MERCVILRIDDGGSRWHGAVVTRRLMHGDGLAQEGDAVWCRGPFLNICLFRDLNELSHMDVYRHILECRFIHFVSYVVTC